MEMEHFSVATHHFKSPNTSTITLSCPNPAKEWGSTTVDQTATRLLRYWPIGNNLLGPNAPLERSRIVLVLGDSRDFIKIEEASTEIHSARYHCPLASF